MISKQLMVEGGLCQHGLQADAAQLACPLEAHVLTHLPAHAIAALRGVCRALRRLVDHAPLSCLESACLALLPPDMAGLAQNSQDLQLMLQQQQAALSCMRSGTTSRIHHLSLPSQDVEDITWSRAWPRNSLAIVTRCRWKEQVANARVHSDPETQPAPPLNERFMENKVQLLDAAHFQQVYECSCGWLSLGGNPTRGWCMQPEPRYAHWQQDLVEGISGILLADLNQQRHVLHSMPHVADPDCLSFQLGPSQDLALVLSDCRTSVELVQLADVQPRSTIEAPAPAPASLTLNFEASGTSCKMVISWFEWAPDGTAFAIAWSIGNRVSALTVHEATDGSLRVLIDVHLHLSPEDLAIEEGFWQGFEPEFCWSPASTHLLAMPTNERHAGAVINLDGHVDILHGHHEDLLLVQPPRFSDCGGYVVLVGRTDASDDAEPDWPPDSIIGYIWDVQKRHVVFEWKEHNAQSSGRHVAWAPLPGVCFVPGCLVVLFLAEEGLQGPVCRRCDGPRLPPGQPLKPWSPSGDVLVSFSMLPEASAEFGFSIAPSSKACPAFDSGPDLCHVLWHTAVGLQHHACIKQPVIVSSQPWLPDSLTWHPNPAAHLYAVLHEAGTVYLVSSLSHKCLQIWTPSPSCKPLVQYPSGVRSEYKLQWSPDGTALAVFAGNVNTFLCYGGSI